ncbi:sigma-70 family RNA polymerase sigma factor [Iamia sp. SCSIO 61187]|uniref:RNA polymerase sigma factor n=1 Tax=Iamia sp. SCSIO 61187 TaxID=2722752 RepID=UPI001C62D7A9|nr:sigma-70 family RNA polymerase sigma factor [Iamia sp. SCSIO 61187]QYG91487.1 sigma-70 family RNA polymerase sigma factor [Iamia sp. SCSIO 61187]
MDLKTPVDDAELVRAAQAGDGQAFGVLFDRWSVRVLDVAFRIVRDREVAAEVAQDAFLAAWTGLDRLEQVESFGGWVLRIGRNRALNRLERERRSVPVGDEETMEMVDRRAIPDDEAATAASRSEDVDLVWAAAAALGPRDASVLDLHLRHGLSPGEIAEELGVAANTAHQALFRLRARLGDAVRACVLWRAGHPACPELGRTLVAAGVEAFGADAVRVTTAHVADCEACARRQEGRLAPDALFAAAPLLVVAPAVITAIRDGLAEAGVPVGEPPAALVGEDADAGDASGDPADAGPGGPVARSARRPAAVAAAAAVLVLVVVAAIVLLGDDGATDPEEVATDATTSTTVPTTTEQASTTTTPTSTTTTPTSTTTAPTTSVPPGSLPAPTPPAPPTTGPSANIEVEPDLGLGPNPDPAPTTTAPAPAPTTTAPPPPPPPAPTIVSFSATRAPAPGSLCTTASARIALSWRTAGTDSVTISGPGAPGGPQPTIGTATGCSPGPGAYTLTASGPGGTTTGTTSVP